GRRVGEVVARQPPVGRSQVLAGGRVSAGQDGVQVLGVDDTGQAEAGRAGPQPAPADLAREVVVLDARSDGGEVVVLLAGGQLPNALYTSSKRGELAIRDAHLRCNGIGKVRRGELKWRGLSRDARRV